MSTSAAATSPLSLNKNARFVPSADSSAQIGPHRPPATAGHREAVLRAIIERTSATAEMGPPSADPRYALVRWRADRRTALHAPRGRNVKPALAVRSDLLLQGQHVESWSVERRIQRMASLPLSRLDASVSPAHPHKSVHDEPQSPWPTLTSRLLRPVDASVRPPREHGARTSCVASVCGATVDSRLEAEEERRPRSLSCERGCARACVHMSHAGGAARIASAGDRVWGRLVRCDLARGQPRLCSPSGAGRASPPVPPGGGAVRWPAAVRPRLGRASRRVRVGRRCRRARRYVAPVRAGR